MTQKRINIYTNKEERKKIDALKVKYQLSLTTIIDILCEVTKDALLLNADENIKNRFYNEHLYMKTDKTSIKEPKSLINQKLDHKNRFINNCLHAYLSNEIHLYIKNADILSGKYGYWNRIENEMQKRQDTWWQYNQYIRMQRRFNRENEKPKSNT